MGKNTWRKSIPQAGFEDVLLAFKQIQDSAKHTLQYRNNPTTFQISGLQPGVRVTPGVHEDILRGKRKLLMVFAKLKKKNMLFRNKY
jgi:hypothetical protein